MTRIGTKRGQASHVRRSDRLLKPQLRCALHFVYCAARLHSFCFLASCRFANCAICSLVAGFTLMVCVYRIIVLRCRWLNMPEIRGKTSPLISRLCVGATGVAEILFEQLVRLARLPRVSLPWVTQLFFAYHPATAVDWPVPAQSRL